MQKGLIPKRQIFNCFPKMLISSPKYGPITLAPVNPDNIPGLLLPGSNTLYCKRDFGTILIQEFNAKHYSIRYCIYNFLRKMTLIFKEEKIGIIAKYALKGNVNLRTANKDKFHLREGQFVLLGGADDEETILFDKENEYKLLNTAYSVDALRKPVTAFPSLKEFISNTSSRKGSLMLHQPRFGSPEMTEIIYDLLKCPYDENPRRLYFENKVKDYLFELLVQTYLTKPADVKLMEKEKDAVIYARDIILTDLSQHFTIREISQQVRLNEFKLKAGFKALFGTGIFEYLLQARMQKARRLLTETDKPIKEIASLSGHQRLTNFITAFRKYYGYTPGSLRRK